MMDNKEAIEGIHALAGLSPDDQLFYTLQLDKEHHAAYAVLVQPSLDAIRAIVAEEVRKALADVRQKGVTQESGE
jgi:hypothetical protein